MRLLDRYIGRELIISFFFAVATLTFVLVLGQILKKLSDYVVDHNVPVSYIITFIAYFLPLSLIYSIPWGLLTAVLLVFGRLSAGNELTAMRTAGVSIPRITRPVFVIALGCSLLCLWINLSVAPTAQQNLKNAFIEVATSNPTAALTGDKVIDDFPGKKIYVRNKEGNRLEEVHVFDLDSNNKPVRVVFAKTGSLETDLEHKQIIMRLENATFEQRDYQQPDDLTKIHPGITMGDFSFPISLEELFARKQGRQKAEVFPYGELVAFVESRRDQYDKDAAAMKASGNDDLRRTVRNDIAQLTAARTELNKRFSFSLACLTFTLFGVPLGITAQRQETSVGFGLSICVAFTYFLIIIVVNTMRENPSVHPELLIWLPNVIFLLLGAVLFFRLSRR